MNITLDPKMLKPIMLWRACAAVLMLVSLWMAWSSWNIYSANRLNHKTTYVRRHIADQLDSQLQSSLTQLNGLKNHTSLLAALDHQDAAAKAIVLQSLPEAQAVEFIAPDLTAAYADPAAFGYGKLGLLETASQQQTVAAAVLKEADSIHLGLALPMLSQGKVAQFIYVRLPIEPLVATVKDTAPSGAYVALRQGHYNIAESGARQELQFKAEADAIKLEGTPLRVVAAAPLVATGMYGLGGWGEFIFALVLALASPALWWWAHARERSNATATEDEGEYGHLTLAELQRANQTAEPEIKTTVKKAKASEEIAIPKANLDRSIFRAYDIRGVVGETLDVDVARQIGEAIGSIMAQSNQRTIVVGRDGRLSSSSMAQALIQGLRKAGRDVIDIGEVPTPLVYFGTYHLRTGCGVAVTGSHNPPDYNGFKIVINTETLSGAAIQDIYTRIVENRLHVSGNFGQLEQRDLKADYISRVAGDIQIERKLKVVIDCGNGVGGALAPELLNAIGAQVEPLFCEVDGTFPHHHPDPSDPANMQDLINVVQRMDADIGLALDGDGDRLGVVTKAGEMIYPDRLLMLFAADVLERNPGACVIYDVKCTGHLATQILRYGGSPLMWKTGHSFIKGKMKETEAELAGEMSGHFFFRERWYGFDDGLYAAARLLEILASRQEDVETIFAALPKGVSTPEIKVELAEGEQYRYVEKFVAQAKFEGARIATIDGLRADWPDGWGLVRASNTTPVLVLRFDANDEAALARIQTEFRKQMLAVDPNLELPF